MAEIILETGEVLIVDDRLADIVRCLDVRIYSRTKDGRPKQVIIRKNSVAALVLAFFGYAVPNGMQIDHKNRNPLDNRIRNLRVVTPKENQANCGPRTTTTSRFRCVSYYKKQEKYRVSYAVGGAETAGAAKYKVSLGYYKSEALAGAVANVGLKYLFGRFAYQNSWTPVLPVEMQLQIISKIDKRLADIKKKYGVDFVPEGAYLFEHLKRQP